MTRPIFFSEHVDAAVSGKTLGQALDALGKLISEATVDMEFGYGPPASEIGLARRKWLDLYEQARAA